MGVSIADIARKAGVSRPLVSRLLNEDPTLKVNEDKRQAVFAAMHELHEADGSSPRLGRGNRLCNVVYPLNVINKAEHIRLGATHMAIFDGIGAATAGWRQFRVNISLFAEEQKHKFIQDILDFPYAEGLLLGQMVVDQRLADMLRASGFPHASYDDKAEPYGVNVVCPNVVSGLRQVVAHLRELGHEHIGYVGPRRYQDSLLLGVLHDNGLDCDPDKFCFIYRNANLEFEDVWPQRARVGFAGWLDEGHAATALICHNELIASGVIDVMTERGLVPGKDISLAAFNNAVDVVEGGKAPFLTSLLFPGSEMGKRIRQMLANQIAGRQDGIINEKIPMPFVVGQSTGPCPKQ